MKVLKKLSLKMQITLLTGGILMICSIFLAIGASYNAHYQFEDIFQSHSPHRLKSKVKLHKSK